jgi:murein DD-endopeptidase MepM/ murein hydrolase activator NlpD
LNLRRWVPWALSGIVLLVGAGYPAQVEGGDLTLPFIDQEDYDSINSWFDHTYPLLGGDPDPTMTMYDGTTGGSYDSHNSIDFPLWYEPVLAAAPGTVTLATFNLCAGNYIRVYHAELGYSTYYMHLYQFNVTSGPVSRGDQIAVSGDTGSHPDCITGPHLHFAARTGQTGQDAIDPYGWAEPWGAGRPVDP